MMVRAVFRNGRYGFYGIRRRDGDVFEIPDGEALASWMVPAEDAGVDSEPVAAESGGVDEEPEPSATVAEDAPKKRSRGRPKKSAAPPSDGAEQTEEEGV